MIISPPLTWSDQRGILYKQLRQPLTELQQLESQEINISTFPIRVNVTDVPACIRRGKGIPSGQKTNNKNKGNIGI